MTVEAGKCQGKDTNRTTRLKERTLKLDHQHWKQQRKMFRSRIIKERGEDKEVDSWSTCPEAELVKVEAAAVVGLTQVVAAAVGGLQLDQLETPVPAGPGGGRELGRRAI